ncbi:uncharacterized protein LOC127455332 [Myxocyprinus asiaticus]|uniref:uncharacterized protein LOC127455332 n=1 Tax=Myxocyprinus asiaticus TaxID=70543 RepID=UPI00222326B8|nr:uncharacterized protein LOC127455332 [Myxocyprinus asiaticus]
MLLIRGITRFRKVILGGGQRRVIFNTPYLIGKGASSCNHQNASSFSGVMESHFNYFQIGRALGTVECARALGGCASLKDNAQGSGALNICSLRCLWRSQHGLEHRPVQQHVHERICLFHQDHRLYSGLKQEEVDPAKNAPKNDSKKHKQMGDSSCNHQNASSFSGVMESHFNYFQIGRALGTVECARALGGCASLKDNVQGSGALNIYSPRCWWRSQHGLEHLPVYPSIYWMSRWMDKWMDG